MTIHKDMCSGAAPLEERRHRCLGGDVAERFIDSDDGRPVGLEALGTRPTQRIPDTNDDRRTFAESRHGELSRFADLKSSR